MPLKITRNRIIIFIILVIVLCLVIAGIIVGIIFATKKHKDSKTTTTSTSSTLPTSTATTTTTTVTQFIEYYPENLIIAFNIGYQNDSTSIDSLRGTLIELNYKLNLGSALTIQVLPYADKPGNISEPLKSSQEFKTKIDFLLSNPENITGKNPSQTDVLKTIKSLNVQAAIHNPRFALQAIKTKFCLFSPSKSSYFNPDKITLDAQGAGVVLNEITTTFKFALVLMKNISINDYKVFANQNFLDTTYDKIDAIVQFLDPDTMLLTTPPSLVTNITIASNTSLTIVPDHETTKK